MDLISNAIKLCFLLHILEHVDPKSKHVRLKIQAVTVRPKNRSLILYYLIRRQKFINITLEKFSTKIGYFEYIYIYMKRVKNLQQSISCQVSNLIH